VIASDIVDLLRMGLRSPEWDGFVRGLWPAPGSRGGAPGWLVVTPSGQIVVVVREEHREK